LGIRSLWSVVEQLTSLEIFELVYRSDQLCIAKFFDHGTTQKGHASKLLVQLSEQDKKADDRRAQVNVSRETATEIFRTDSHDSIKSISFLNFMHRS
jgi:hypothetical protein